MSLHKKFDVSDFKNIFGISMSDVSKRIGKTKESVSMIFRVLPASDNLLKDVAFVLKEIADKNLRDDIEIAKYRREKAERIIEFCLYRTKGNQDESTGKN